MEDIGDVEDTKTQQVTGDTEDMEDTGDVEDAGDRE